MTQSTPKIQLTFSAGYFRMYGIHPIQLKQLSRNAHWQKSDDGIYQTKDLGAAAHFQVHADEKAQKIFNRIFQSRYELPENYPPRVPLDAHQWEGLEWILTRKRSYLAHAPGAGKTAQAILAASLCRFEGQTLFIVPPSLTKNWEREIEKFTAWVGDYSSYATVPRSDHQADMDWTAGIIICPDSMLTRPWVYDRLRQMKKKFIAVDEASRFKESTSKRSLAFYGGRIGQAVYPGLFKDAPHVVFLDGSPMPNRPMELWAPTYALDPEAIDCMSQDDFGYRYCGAKPNERGVWEYLWSSNEAELKSKLQASFMHVVGEDRLEHPERLRSILVIDKDVRTPEHKTWERLNIPAFRVNEDASQGDLARFRKELGMSKVPFIGKYVAQRLKDKNESILLFVWHREVAQDLAVELASFDPGVVIGGSNEVYREGVFEQFQAGERKLLIMNIAAGGRGHNLQKADRVIFGEYSWTDELNRQCEKRASRRGNDSLFTRCEYIVAPNSMDEMVLSTLFTKQKRVEKVIG
jgi:SWI/SNF-related matrix-associated actin-dependent regulator 1 of chromatin subfamily A